MVTPKFRSYHLGIFFLYLIVSSEAIALKRKVDEAVNTPRYLESHAFGGGMDNLTPEQIIEIHNSLKESLSSKNSPVLMELKELSPVNQDASPKEMTKYKREISNILHKSVQPLQNVIGLLEMHGVGDILTSETKGKNLASGECEKTVSLLDTCDTNDECKSSKTNPCKGLCQCNTDRINNCECVVNITFDNPLAGALDNEASIVSIFKASKSSPLEALLGFVDGFLGGMFTDIRTPWKNNKHCLAFKSDFRDGIKDVIHSFKELLHAIKSNAKILLFSKAARNEVLAHIRSSLQALFNFFRNMIVGLVKCPAAQQIAITLGVILTALKLNMLMITAGWVIVPLIIKWVGAIVGLYFSMNYLHRAYSKLQMNLELKKQDKCKTKCENQVAFHSFSIVGCIGEILILGAVADTFQFMKGKRGAIEFNTNMVHDITVVKQAVKVAKNAKVRKQIGNMVKKLVLKKPPKNLLTPWKPRIKPRVMRKWCKSCKVGKHKTPVITDKVEAEKMLNKGIFACDAAESGKLGRNPILDNAKAKKGKIPDAEYQKEIQSARNNANSFKDGQYNVVELKEPITLYRAGPKDRALGQYWTRTPPKTRFEVRRNAAVKSEWSSIDSVYQVEIPAGTKLYEGYVAPQGGKYTGSGKQIFIEKPWDIPGVKDNVKKIATMLGDGKSFGHWKGAMIHTNLNAVKALGKVVAEKVKNAQGTRCKSGSGVCIDTYESTCTVDTVAGKCEGALHILCCPSSKVVSHEDHRDAAALPKHKKGHLGKPLTPYE